MHDAPAPRQNLRMQPPLGWRLVLGLAWLLGIAGAGPRASATDDAWIIDARGSARRFAIVSFEAAARPGRWEMRTPEGQRRPVQFEGGQAWFIEPELPADAVRTYTLKRRAWLAGSGTLPSAKAHSVAHDHDGADFDFAVDGHPVVRYLAHSGTLPRADIPEIYRRGGYFHPLWTPAGRIVTGDYPTNHVHHHGFWWAWTKTEFEGRTPDFWNMGEKKGRVDFVRSTPPVSGPVWAGFRSEHVYTDLLADPAKPALHETWRVRVYPLAGGLGVNVIDVDSEQVCATPSPLKLPKYLYGGLGYRGPTAWDGADGIRYLDSNGVTNRVDGNFSHARWYWMGGLVDGHLAGVAVLGHPANFRAPQPLRVHPTEPYACWAPSQQADWSIKPGEPYRSRYRILALDGVPDAAQLNRLWDDFATPVAVRAKK